MVHGESIACLALKPPDGPRVLLRETGERYTVFEPLIEPVDACRCLDGRPTPRSLEVQEGYSACEGLAEGDVLRGPGLDLPVQGRHFGPRNPRGMIRLALDSPPAVPGGGGEDQNRT